MVIAIAIVIPEFFASPKDNTKIFGQCESLFCNYEKEKWFLWILIFTKNFWGIHGILEDVKNFDDNVNFAFLF